MKFLNIIQYVFIFLVVAIIARIVIILYFKKAIMVISCLKILKK